MNPRELMIASFRSAVAAADPLRIVPGHLPSPPKGRTLVVGAGKAAGAMALAVEQHWPVGAPLDGIVVTRYQHGLLSNRIKVIEAGHPVPDEAGEAAAKEMLRRVRALGKEDLLLVLVSGGGSSLLTLPDTGLTLADLKATTRELLHCGAPIQHINTVRKHLSGILGGRLAAASKAPVLALIVSDVTGDDPTHIASGPCAPDPSTYGDALKVIARYGVQVPPEILAHLGKGARGGLPETPKHGGRLFDRVENRVIATAQSALQAGAALFRSHGVQAVVLGDTITGEASEVAKVHGAVARQIARHGEPWKPPVAVISGGECTVALRGDGRGGRCAQFLLSLALDAAGMEGLWALACDTDGIDGSENNAGAVLSPDSLRRAAAQGLDAASLAENNDAWAFFSGLDDLVITGPTRTNVNDYRVMLLV